MILILERIKYWIDISEYNLETADIMLENKRFLYVGFMCHQAIEKILKGYYVFKKDENPPYTHNLSYLANQINIFKGLPEKLKDTIDLISPLNIETRYPTYKEKLMQALNYKRCKEIIDNTKELHIWIKNQLSKALKDMQK